MRADTIRPGEERMGAPYNTMYCGAHNEPRYRVVGPDGPIGPCYTSRDKARAEANKRNAE